MWSFGTRHQLASAGNSECSYIMTYVGISSCRTNQNVTSFAHDSTHFVVRCDVVTLMYSETTAMVPRLLCQHLMDSLIVFTISSAVAVRTVRGVYGLLFVSWKTHWPWKPTPNTVLKTSGLILHSELPIFNSHYEWKKKTGQVLYLIHPRKSSLRLVEGYY